MLAGNADFFPANFLVRNRIFRRTPGASHIHRLCPTLAIVAARVTQTLELPRLFRLDYGRIWAVSWQRPSYCCRAPRATGAPRLALSHPPRALPDPVIQARRGRQKTDRLGAGHVDQSFVT